MDGDQKSSGSLEKRIRRHVIAREHGFFAVVQPGFEKTACRELATLGITPGKTTEGGLEFSGRLETCYRANVASRTVTRVLMRLTEFHAENERVLARKISSIPWELYLPHDIPVHIYASASHSRLYHTGLIADSVQKGIEASYKQPFASTAADAAKMQRVYVRIHENLCTVSLDTSGEGLYRRGRKRHVTDAPLRETLASLILNEASFGDYPVLFDPMCGSGTFALEAAEHISGVLPGSGREFPFMRWPAFRPASFNHLLKKLNAEITAIRFPQKVIAWDRDEKAVNTALYNISEAGLSGRVFVEKKDFFIDFPDTESDLPLLLVMNPPYGKRIDRGKTEWMYEKIGSVIRKYYREAGFAIIVPGEEHEKILNLRWDRKIPFFNGGIPAALIVRDARPRR